MRVFFPLLVMTWLVVDIPSTGVATEYELDLAFIRQVQAGHKRLSDNVKMVSGSIRRWRGERGDGNAVRFETSEMAEKMSATFHVLEGATRLEYQKVLNTATIQNPNKRSAEQEGLCEVVVQTPDLGMHYNPVSITGTPYATLFVHRDPLSPTIELRVSRDLAQPLRALFEIGNSSVIELIQRMQVSIETRSFESGGRAICLIGSTRKGNESQLELEFVLDPQKDFALIGYSSKEETGQFETSYQLRARTIELSTGCYAPSSLAVVVETKQNGSTLANSSYHEVIRITYDKPARPENALFSIEGFAELGRDYTIVEVSSDESKKIGRTITVDADRYGRSGETSEHRVYLRVFAAGVALVVLGVLLAYRRSRTKRGEGPHA